MVPPLPPRQTHCHHGCHLHLHHSHTPTLILDYHCSPVHAPPTRSTRWWHKKIPVGSTHTPKESCTTSCSIDIITLSPKKSYLMTRMNTPNVSFLPLSKRSENENWISSLTFQRNCRLVLGLCGMDGPIMISYISPGDLLYDLTHP